MSWKVWTLIGAAILLLAAVTYTSETSFLEAFLTMLRGSLGSAGAISGTLKDTTALLITGLAVFVAYRAGLFNIGVEGQFIVGACASAFFALWLQGFWGLLAGILAGLLAGALWAYPAGLIRAYRGGHEVITTIMMNYVALSVTTALVSGPLRDRSSQEQSTASLGPAGIFPFLVYRTPLEISFALIVALALVVGFSYWLKGTVAGYELRAVGANWRAATVAGADTKKIQVWAMTVSGSLAGLAGALHVLAYEGRFYKDFSPGYGFDALGVALLAGPNALGTIPAAFAFGILNRGSASLQILGIPKGIVLIVLGVLIIVFSAVRYRRRQVQA